MSVPTTSEAWLHELKHYKSFNDYIVDLSDPYGKAIATFQLFTRSIIEGLERKDFEVESLIHDGSLHDIYSELPSFAPEVLKPWVKDAMLMHPLRRTAKQYHFLVIVQIQGRGELKSPRDISVSAKIELDDWKSRAYNPENLDKDPDALYFFRNKNGIKDIDPSQEDANFTPECVICDNLFDEDAHLTQQAPCGHVVCRACFGEWLKQCNGTYTCMLCRACAVCGANDCPHHDVHQERARPHPLSLILDLVIPDKAGEVLHGIKAERYWGLREATRADREVLAWMEQILEVHHLWPGDPSRVWWEKDAEEILSRVTEAVREAVTEA